MAREEDDTEQQPAPVEFDHAAWKRLSVAPSFGHFLTSLPLDDPELPERDRTPLREVDL